MRKNEERFIVDIDFSQIANDAQRAGYENVKVFYIVESFVKGDNGTVVHLLSVSPRSETGNGQLFFSATYDSSSANGFEEISKRADIRESTYYEHILGSNVISTETKIRVQFERDDISVLIELLDDNSLSVAKVSHDYMGIDAGEFVLSQFPSVTILKPVTDRSIESVFYYHALSQQVQQVCDYQY